MVRRCRQTIPPNPRSPHPRGDGPHENYLLSSPVTFSPPAWGWSANVRRGLSARGVLPTRVGMVRRWPARRAARSCSPHPRGDGPASAASLDACSPFSPPAWGWSVLHTHWHVIPAVLPTRVGMVRETDAWKALEDCSPHPRGDGPAPIGPDACAFEFSPPAWGWSVLHTHRHVIPAVLPTRVGMVRPGHPATRLCTGSPHPRGDGPASQIIHGHDEAFSPPAWGWSAVRRPEPRDGLVLPTRVGMVRTPSTFTSSIWSSPHPRGDGPRSAEILKRGNTFSPPAWGWSADHRRVRLQLPVLPTRVGMVRSNEGSRSTRSGSPHPRGDGPLGLPDKITGTQFSPPAWGWSGDRV